ncbi:hypothetical protein ZOSMA_376G00010, partial [Zostera marina]
MDAHPEIFNSSWTDEDQEKVYKIYAGDDIFCVIFVDLLMKFPNGIKMYNTIKIITCLILMHRYVIGYAICDQFK